MKRENWKGWNWSHSHGMPVAFIKLQRAGLLLSVLAWAYWLFK